jgi:hypothetical protein
VVPAVAGLALLAGTSAADPVPLPPIPTVTVSVPSPPVPLPVLPNLPKPAVAAPPVDRATPTAPALLQVTATTAAAGGNTSFPSSGGVSASSSSSSPSTSSGAHAEHFHSSRTWIGTTGSKRRRTTTLTFVLQQAGPVVFTVNQVSPACVGIGRFTVAGHAGLNRVPFAGVVHDRPLGPGTYRLSIRTASGAVVGRVTLVVVAGSAPSRDELRSMRTANTCRGNTAAPGSSSTTAVTANLPRPPAQGGADGLAPQVPDVHSGVLASSVEKTARAIQPLLIALLAASILLLGLASLPPGAVPEPRVHYALASHRLEIAALGAAALVAGAIVVLLGV